MSKAYSFVAIVTLVLAIGLTGSLFLAFSGSTVLAVPPQDPPEPDLLNGNGIVPGTAPAQAAPSALPAAPGVLYKAFMGTDFHPLKSGYQFEYVSGGAVYPTVASSFFNARLDLPNGSQITEIRFFFADDSGTDVVYMNLARYDPSTRSVDYIFLQSSSGSPSSTSVQSLVYNSSPLPVTVDNASYTYQLEMGTSGNTSATQIVGARVGYTVPAAYLPLILKNAM